jgi:hypothetical protein
MKTIEPNSLADLAEVDEALKNGKKVTIFEVGPSNTIGYTITGELFQGKCIADLMKLVYRIEDTEDYIDFSIIDKRFIAYARDAYGESYVFEEIPKFNNGDQAWFSQNGHCRRVDDFVSPKHHKIGDVHWTESLLLREDWEKTHEL